MSRKTLILATCCLAITLTQTPAISSPAPQSADIDRINLFCERFVQNTENDFKLINTDNVSQGTFTRFSTAANTNLRPGLKRFFAELRAMGATKCVLN